MLQVFTHLREHVAVEQIRFATLHEKSGTDAGFIFGIRTCRSRGALPNQRLQPINLIVEEGEPVFTGSDFYGGKFAKTADRLPGQDDGRHLAGPLLNLLDAQQDLRVISHPRYLEFDRLRSVAEFPANIRRGQSGRNALGEPLMIRVDKGSEFHRFHNSAIPLQFLQVLAFGCAGCDV